MKIIRDNVHGDIAFSPSEMGVIHTRAFQRLHGCRQLGLTYLIYPGAKHSRFEHVLGVTHVATQIGRALKDSKGEPYIKDDLVTEPAKGISPGKLLRLAALLHDMGHVPFGHTLEDEMPIIFPKHDEPSTAHNLSRMDAVVTEVLRLSRNEKYIEPVLRVLRAISDSKDDEALYGSVDRGETRPEFVVLADIIGNTICADLLDYIIRDHMMTGIRATYDNRIFQYFGVGQHLWKGKSYDRVVIKLVRSGRFRKDALADLLDILKLRYNLSDKVLFHPKKCSADAMLIKAVSRRRLKVKRLMQYSDDALLDAFKEDSLVQMIRKRDLFKPVFWCGLDDISTFQIAEGRKEEVIQDLHENEGGKRTKIEELLEHRLGFPRGRESVLVFFPPPKMTLKPVRALVQWKDNTVRRLNEIPRSDDPVTCDQVAVLQDMYPRLWKLYLFVRPELRGRGHKIKQEFLSVLKEETGLTARCDPAFENYLERGPVGSFDYKIGMMFDKELEHRGRYVEMPPQNKDLTWRRCLAKLSGKKDGIAPYDDRFEDSADITELASHDEGELKSHVRRVVDAVLGKRRVGRKS